MFYVRGDRVITYLAGPMMDCNDEEMFGWRREAKELLGDILDPTVRDYRGHTDEHVEEIVEMDKAEIDASTYLLAYCPKASYGTIMEILYAWERNKKVVVVIPPGVAISPWLIYHSHIILRSVDAACIFILNDINQKQTEKVRKNMSANKLNYYTVTTTSVVRANNKTDAIAVSMNRRGITGEFLNRDVTVDRIPATEAHALVQSA